MSESSMNRLFNMGFRSVGLWRIDEGRLILDLKECALSTNVLYAFIMDDEVVYIGKTIQKLKQRLRGYATPGPTQSTNIKGNRLITEALNGGRCVDIFALPDTGLLTFGGFHLNLSAGLEDSLVSTLKPRWNTTGKK